MAIKADESLRKTKATDCIGSSSALRSKLWALGYKVSSTNMARFLDMLNSMNDFEESYSGSPENVSAIEEDSTESASPLGHLSEAFSSLELMYTQLEERFSEAIGHLTVPDVLDEHKQVIFRQDRQGTVQGNMSASEASDLSRSACAIELHQPKQKVSSTAHARPLECKNAPHAGTSETGRNPQRRKSDPVNRYREMKSIWARDPFLRHNKTKNR